MSIALDHPAPSLVGSHLDLEAVPTRRARDRPAVRDVADGMRLWRLAVTLGAGHGTSLREFLPFIAVPLVVFRG